jgi:DNA-binding NarL/FixJ family response regulator
MARPLVMVADDDASFRAGLEEILQTAGFEVVAFGCFEDAHAYLEDHTPDVVVSDVRLGAYNGVQLVLLARARQPASRAVVISAFDDPFLRKEARRAGACYLLKPVTIGAILEAVGHPGSA